MKSRAVMWKAVEYEGLEYLELNEDAFGIQVASTIIGADEQQAFLVDYLVNCDANYLVSSVLLNLGNETLDLTSDGRGGWLDRDMKRLPEFDGCIDIDITATPFTNTLPIRRVDWRVGQSEDFKMLYISVPALKLSVSRQRYTCLEKSADGGLFRFEVIDGDFTALLPVDRDGLVLDYPGLFKRVWAS